MIITELCLFRAFHYDGWIGSLLAWFALLSLGNTYGSAPGGDFMVIKNPILLVTRLKLALNSPLNNLPDLSSRLAIPRSEVVNSNGDAN